MSTKPPIVIVMGLAGAGKSTVGAALARALRWPFIDADDLHPAGNVEKMRRGIALTEADRAPWLDRLRARIDTLLAAEQPAVVACSALRRAYRAYLRADAVRFVYLKADYELLRARLEARKHHFMNPTLLGSQAALLEEPTDAVVVDAALPVDEIVRHVRAALAI
ncbi:MAG: gluconokinase [Sulfurifustis sp.]